MSFMHDIPPQLEQAVFSGLTASILSKIGEAQRSITHYGATFEQEFFGEDIKAVNSFSGRFLSIRPTSPARPAEWLLGVTQSCCFSMTSVVCGLIYLDRVIKDRKVLFSSSTWDLVWVSLMVLSEKFWEDNFIHPGHILFTATNDHIFSATDRSAYVEMQNMQFWLLRALDWRLNIDCQVFDSWVRHLQYLGYQSNPAMQASSIFIQRPIPNLKVRRTSYSTASTATPDDVGDLYGPDSAVNVLKARSDSDFSCHQTQGMYHCGMLADPRNHYGNHGHNFVATDAYWCKSAAFPAHNTGIEWYQPKVNSFQSVDRQAPEALRFPESGYACADDHVSQMDRVSFSRFPEEEQTLSIRRSFSDVGGVLPMHLRYSLENRALSFGDHFPDPRRHVSYAPILVQPHTAQIVVNQLQPYQPVGCCQSQQWVQETPGCMYLQL